MKFIDKAYYGCLLVLMIVFVVLYFSTKEEKDEGGEAEKPKALEEKKIPPPKIKETKKKPAPFTLKKPEKCPNDYQVFQKVYWPSFLENECGPNRENRCCVKTAGDAGGLTCYGIAIEYNNSFYSYLKEIGHDVTKDDPRKIKSKVIEPYSRMKIYIKYFREPKIHLLPLSLREVVFDNAVHAGPGRAVKILQGLCGVKQDGRIGSKTAGACSKISFDKYIEAREKWLKTKPSWKRFKKGFEARLKRQYKQAEFSIKKEESLKCQG